MLKSKGMEVTETAYFIIFNAVSQFPQNLSLHLWKETEMGDTNIIYLNLKCFYAYISTWVHLI